MTSQFLEETYSHNSGIFDELGISGDASTIAHNCWPVFVTSKGRIVKFARRCGSGFQDEAAMARKFMELKPRHVVNIFNVIEIKLSEDPCLHYYGENGKGYLIEMEQLQESTFSSLADLRRKYLPALEELAKLGYTHGDAHSGNLLYSPEEGIHKLIDVESFEEYYEGYDYRDICMHLLPRHYTHVK